MGSDLTDVTWIESNGHRLWYFTKEQQMTDQFMYELELQRWYGKKSYAQTNAVTIQMIIQVIQGESYSRITNHG